MTPTRRRVVVQSAAPVFRIPSTPPLPLEELGGVISFAQTLKCEKAEHSIVADRATESA
jgi:hypothetical protein